MEPCGHHVDQTTDSEEIPSKIFYNPLSKETRFNLKLVGREFKAEIFLLLQMDFSPSRCFKVRFHFREKLTESHDSRSVYRWRLGTVWYRYDQRVTALLSKHTEGFRFKQTHQ